MSLVLVGPVCDPVASRLGSGPGHIAAPLPGTQAFLFFPAAVGFHCKPVLRTTGLVSFPQQCEAFLSGEKDFSGPSGFSHSLFVRPLEDEPIPLVL